MPKNKGIVIAITLYIMSILLIVVYTVGLISLINQTNSMDASIRSTISPLRVVVILMGIVISILSLTTVGLIRMKKWGYRLALVLGILSFISLLGSLAGQKPNFFNILPIASGIILFFNKKQFI